jgi:hypothetical protein
MSIPQKKFRIDLSDVEFVDEKGEALLERLFQEDAELYADNAFLRSVIAEIVQRSLPEHINRYEKVSE